ncbi:MAG: hypothetical protein GF344_18050 [Chitinivibrionales bacterium]|nr:hypothetical protein [Chitinivibrionales bacterium]MBD3358560.1 hypothetical protein [Chitinivibrionales bacterium]
MQAQGVLSKIFLISVIVASVVNVVSAQGDSLETIERVVNLQASNGKGAIVLTWSIDPPQPDAIFEIWRRKAGERKMERVASGLTLPCYVDDEVRPGITYHYGLKWDVFGKETGKSNTIAVKLAPRHLGMLIYPGIYQIRSQQTVKGGLIAAGGTLSLLATAGSGAWYLWSRSESERLRDEFNSRLKEDADSQLKTIFDDWNEAYDREDGARTVLYASAISFGTIMLYHIVDALIFPRTKACRTDAVPGFSSVHPYLGVEPGSGGNSSRYAVGVRFTLPTIKGGMQ